jgi:hypothetical protein
MTKSKILNSTNLRKILLRCKFSFFTKLTLLYRASEDGFTAKAFHEKCDDFKKVLIIIKSDLNHVFGGYSAKGWSPKNSGYSYDSDAVLYSHINKDAEPCVIKCSMPDYAIYYDSNFGPVFGAGMDLLVANNSNETWDSSCRLGYSYKHPFYDDYSEEAKSFLAGSHYFKIEEIEVFKLN